MRPLVLATVFLPAAAGLGDANDWVASFGYVAVFLLVALDGVFPVFPGESSIVAAAVFAASGELSLTTVILAGALGAVVGDSGAFAIGHHGGDWMRRTLARRISPARLRAVEHMVHRQGNLLVLSGRFLTGIRLAINILCGAGSMTYRRFLAIDAVAALIWSTQAALIGYVVSILLPGREWLSLVVALGVAGAIMLVIWRRERARLRREEALLDAESAQE